MRRVLSTAVAMAMVVSSGSSSAEASLFDWLFKIGKKSDCKEICEVECIPVGTLINGVAMPPGGYLKDGKVFDANGECQSCKGKTSDIAARDGEPPTPVADPGPAPAPAPPAENVKKVAPPPKKAAHPDHEKVLVATAKGLDAKGASFCDVKDLSDELKSLAANLKESDKHIDEGVPVCFPKKSDWDSNKALRDSWLKALAGAGLYR